MMRPGGGGCRPVSVGRVRQRWAGTEESSGRKCGGEDPERGRERERGKSGQQKPFSLVTGQIPTSILTAHRQPPEKKEG